MMLRENMQQNSPMTADHYVFDSYIGPDIFPLSSHRSCCTPLPTLVQAYRYAHATTMLIYEQKCFSFKSITNKCFLFMEIIQDTI